VYVVGSPGMWNNGLTVACVLTVRISSICELAQSVLAHLEADPLEHMQE
jgi:hypothetical protein